MAKVVEASQDALDLIINFEGLRLEPYIDAAGFWTVGYGHLLKEKCKPITVMEAEDLLLKDVKYASMVVNKYVSVPLRQHEFDALVSFIFNVGEGRFRSSTLRRKLNRGEFFEVPKEFRRWVYAGGRILRGLVTRRELEAQLFYLGDIEWTT